MYHEHMEHIKKDPTTWTLANKPSFAALTGDKACDVLVVGAGLAGILSAYALATAGKKVILIEQDEIARGITELTTAFLTESQDTDPNDLKKIYGFLKASKIMQAHRDAITWIETLTQKHQIECEFMRCSNYIYAKTKSEAKNLKDLQKSFENLGSEVIIQENTDFLSFKNLGYLEIKNQAKFQPLKFIHALTQELTKMGVEIFEKTEAVKIDKKSDSNLYTITTKTEKVNSIIEAEHVVAATYWPLFNPFSLYFRKGTYLSYVFELDLKHNTLPEGTYEDSENPYHYFRIDKKEDGSFRAVVGGEDHREDIKIHENRNWNSLYDYAVNTFGKDNFTLVQKWAGEILEPLDGVASIGRKKSGENIYYAFGFSGNGMTYAAITANLLKDLILKKENELQEIFAPYRIPSATALLLKGRDYAGEFEGGVIKNMLTQSKKLKF